MRIVDCHVHMGSEVQDPDGLLRAMDDNGVDRTIVISQAERNSLQRTRENLAATKRLFDYAPDRLSGLARVDPTIPGMVDLARRALVEMGFVGIKIIPDHWYPYEERVEPFWEAMNELGASILFHTGILYGFEDGSRFCKPLYLEKLLFYPRIRFSMAHISWPWCDECLAVMGRMRAARGYNVDEWQSYIDITPGPPLYIRKQAFSNALQTHGAERMLLGTDGSVPGDLSHQKRNLESYLRIFDELELSEADRERILSGTADELFPPRG